MQQIIFLPVILFLAIYLGAGIYYTLHGVDQAFYQISPTVCILPSLVLGVLSGKRSFQDNLASMVEGMRHRDILTMCIIFLLAGAFSSVTGAIGSIEATVRMALHFVPGHFLLVGIFLISSFISTAIGTSMGVVALVTPIAAGLAHQGAFSPALGVATVVGGAMFGDNLSMISDTTIASVMSQEADYRAKFRLNARIALIAGVITVFGLSVSGQSYSIPVDGAPLKVMLVMPYLVLLVAGLCGINVFAVLVMGLVSAAGIGFFCNEGYSLHAYARDIYRGFSSMHEIMVLSILIGGLSGLLRDQGAMKIVFRRIADFVARGNVRVRAELMLGFMASVFDVLVANNTIAIILSGDVGREISRKYGIPSHRSAYILDTFSCIFQGIIPYGAQVLLASSLAGVSPLQVSGYVWYCYVLGFVVFLDIGLRSKKKHT